MSGAGTTLRDAALAVARGKMEEASRLYVELTDQARRLRSFSQEARDDATEIVLFRWQGSLERNLESLADHAGTDASVQVRRCSRRGATRQELEARIGRALSDTEVEAIDPFEGDKQVTAYFARALHHAAIEVVRKEKARAERERRAAERPPPPPPVAIPEELLERASDLLMNDLLPRFAETNPKDWRRLRELGSGESARDLARAELGAGTSDEELRRGKALVYQHWTRARQRLIRAVEEQRGDKEFRRRIVPAILLLVDERFRRNTRTVRSSASERREGQSPERSS